MAYTIKVERGQTTGTVKFNSGTVAVNTKCWWDPNNKIDAGTYSGSATWMANKADADGEPCPWKNNAKRRPGIWFGKGVKSNNGTKTNDQIFIHKGTSAAWSDGCIVCAASEVLKIWNAISPKDKSIVSVVVSDQTPKRYMIESRIKDPSVKAALRKALKGDGRLSYDEVCSLIRSTQDYGRVSQQELTDLQTILGNSKTIDARSRQLITQFLRNPTAVLRTL